MEVEMKMFGTELSLFSRHVFELFEGIKGVLFFLKSTDCKIVSGNQLFAEHCGYETVEALNGRSDFDIFPIEIAQQFRTDDLEVMSSKVAKQNVIELFPSYLGDLEWFVTRKIPLFDHSGSVVGLCGTCQSYEGSSHTMRPYQELYPAMQHIKSHLNQKLSNQALAAIAGLSVRQFERRFKQLFHCSAHQYILKLRILKSCDLLLSRNMAMADVALEMGFYDQCAFSNQFKKIIGVSPLKYLKHRL